jgi:hypothetical protein
MVNSDDTFLERIISNITDSGGGELIEYPDYDKDKVEKLLTDSFKKGGNEELIKELENHNFFIVWRDDDYPSNSSLVADLDRCIWFWDDMDIQEYTFLYIEYPDEYKIYLHISSSSHRLYGHTIELINTYSLKTNIGEVFEETVKEYMIGVFWNELEKGLDTKGGQRFLSEMEKGEFSKDFDMGAFFNFDGIEIPQEVKDKAYKKILQHVEDYLEEE